MRRAAIFMAGLMALASTQVQAADLRIYQSANDWFGLANGEVTWSSFVADLPDGARSFGSFPDAEGLYAAVRAAAPARLKRLGISLDPTSGCREAQTTNAAGTLGWAFSCSFAIRTADSPPAVAAAAVKPSKPVAAKPAAPVAKASPAPVVATAPTEPAPIVVAGPPDPAEALNAKVKADNAAVDARNLAVRQKYEADQAAFEAKKRDNAAKYAADLAAHDAEVKALEAQHAREIADWEARVKACKRGDSSQCAK